MVKELSIIIPADKEKDEKFIQSKIFENLKSSNISFKENDVKSIFVKKSIDARRKQVKLCLRYKVYIGENPPSTITSPSLPQWCHVKGDKTVVIIGAGPAGLFGAFKLLEKGIKPLIIERGNPVSQRKRDIAAISTQGIVGENSNYCFGEGGAGTFSDGKLYTRSNKRGDIPSVLKIFEHFGADPKILTDAHPHIGTDRLPQIIQAMREKLISLGGEFLFNTKVTSFIIENKSIKKVVCQDTISGEKKEIAGDAFLLATGHSATDIYEILAKLEPSTLEAKTFAMGVRIEHPREEIDFLQYRGKAEAKNLGAAEYRFVTQVEGRGVYTFCMCPGGFVVPSASGPSQIVVNGMSSAGRNSKWSNSAVVVESRPEDIPEEYKKRALQDGCPALAGLYWRSEIEKLTAEKGNGQKAPAQLLKDFLNHKESLQLPPSSYAPGLVSSSLDKWLPLQISSRLEKAFYDFNSQRPGFISPNAILIASETRTSTPVRIVRNKENGMTEEIKGLFPAGEGSGYSGGIVSSAMDGIKQCEKIIDFLNFNKN